MSQKDRILSGMRRGKHYTPFTALKEIGCFRLAARIAELRSEGHSISVQRVDVGHNRLVASYSLISEAKSE